MSRHLLLRLVPVACAALLTAPLLPTSASAAPAPAQVVAQADPEDPTGRAQDALEQVEEILEGSGPALPATAHEGSDLTMELRDLTLLQDELPPAQREQAASYLSRPTNDRGNDPAKYDPQATVRRVCSAVVCVHFTTDTADDPENAVPRRDDGELYGTAGNGVPDYVDMALAELTRVHNRYVAAGYRAPLPDGNKGGNPLTDIYLVQLGDRGIYGQCLSDDPDAGNWSKHVGVYGYCVLDNDYRPSEYPYHSPRQNLQVTAAHEYFHAVQFGYDIAEDAWIMEATATWAEDELYDRVNDNVFYLDGGPLANPQVPLDAFRGLQPYGAWIFFRHLSERFRGEVGGMPRIVRDMWRLMAADGRNLYSLRAIHRVLVDRGTSLPRQFATFATANRRSRSHYDEGRAERYPVTGLAGRFRLTKAERSRRAATTLDHLSSRTYRFVPGSTLGRGWLLRLRLDLPPANRGGGATVTVKRDGRPPHTTHVRLNRRGNRTISGLGFSRGNVDWVEVTLANVSSRYKCGGRSWRFTCRGTALDDDRRQVVEARAYRR